MAPDRDRFGPLRASFVTPRNVVFRAGERSVIDYQGRVLAEYDEAAGRIEVEGLDAPLVHEAAYQFVLSAMGTHFDAIGLPRLHGLALSGAQGAVVLLLPSGGGKSTLALRAVREPGVRLISEDTPLVGPRGRLLPFVLRMGLVPADAGAAPTATRRIERMEFDAKVAVEVEAFADVLEPDPTPLAHVVVGVRTLGAPARLVPTGRGRAVGPLLREGVVGLGVYQGMEFVLQQGMRDVLGKGALLALRARRCGVALARARVWELELGRDPDENVAALAPLLR